MKADFLRANGIKRLNDSTDSENTGEGKRGIPKTQTYQEWVEEIGCSSENDSPVTISESSSENSKENNDTILNLKSNQLK